MCVGLDPTSSPIGPTTARYRRIITICQEDVLHSDYSERVFRQSLFCTSLCHLARFGSPNPTFKCTFRRGRGTSVVSMPYYAISYYIFDNELSLSIVTKLKSAIRLAVTVKHVIPSNIFISLPIIS